MEATDEAAFEAGAGEVNLRPVMMKFVGELFEVEVEVMREQLGRGESRRR